MKHNSVVNDNQRGMTLIELIIALLILGLAITAFLPLHLMVAKNIKNNQQKQAASILANQEIEKLLSAAWSDQYDNLSTTPAPPATIRLGGVDYTVQRTISWVDDPEDGTFDPAAIPNPDPVPFDYKTATVTISARDPVTHKMKVYATARAKLAKEGAESPFCGAVVTVKRPWEGTPVAGATVSLVNVSGSFSGVTNDQGQAIIPVTLPADTDQAIFAVSAHAGSMIMDPSPSHYNQLTLYNNRSNAIQIDMEEPCSINLRFNDSHRGGSVIITNSEMWPGAGQKTESISAGQTRLTFGGLWPQGIDPLTGTGLGGNYKIELQLTAWQEDFASGAGTFTPYRATQMTPEGSTHYNIWKWQSGEWSARTTNVMLGAGDSYYNLGENSLVSNPGAINLAPYAAHDLAFIPDPDGGGIRFSCKKFAMGGAAAGDFPLIKKNPANADPSDAGWQTIIDRTSYESLPDPVTIKLVPGSDTTKDFALRFEASSDMTDAGFSIDDLQITCFYKQTREFTSPGSSLDIVVSENVP